MFDGPLHQQYGIKATHAATAGLLIANPIGWDMLQQLELQGHCMPCTNQAVTWR